MAGQWIPQSIEEFIADYLKGSTNDELSRKYSGSTDQVKRYIRYLREEKGLPGRKQIRECQDFTFETPESFLESDFISFLTARARRREELDDRFGSGVAGDLLRKNYSGYTLFQQVDEYGRPCYILLPVTRKTLNVGERVWSCYTPEPEDGNPSGQFYHVIQFPEKLLLQEGRIDIIPLYDVHYGHGGIKLQKLLDYINYIKETPHVFTFIGGDLMENALDDMKGMVYDQNIPPGKQVEQVIHLLSEIAHKCLFIIPGNHEWRTYKRAGIDPARIISEVLDIPYFDGPVYCCFLCGGMKWKMYAFHGKGGGMTKGGKINSASRPRLYTDFVNWYVSGHVHDPVLLNDTCIVEDPVRCRLDYRSQWTVICPSFLSYEGSYAYREGYPPPGKGGVRISFYPDGGYDASLTEH